MKKKYLVILIMLSVIMITGCKDKKCIKSHTEESTCLKQQPYFVSGKLRYIMIPYPCEKTVCDEYEEVD